MVSGALLVPGYPFLQRTYSISGQNEREEEIKLLNYNVRVFNNYLHFRSPETSPGALINWVVKHQADIKCFQEFYYFPEDPMFDVIPKIRKNNPYSYFAPSSIVHSHHFGLAIFSKYKMVRKGQVKFPRTTFNQAIFADLVIGKDTVRVYNIHLQSMSIDDKNLPVETDQMYPRILDLIRRLKKGAIYRSGQIQALVDHMNLCPYKIIMSGDLNDTPYSFSYETLRNKLDNAFEKRGNGFGFSYSGMLFFLRIDNIFVDKRIKVNSFKTRKDVKLSDHYPLEASISL